MQKRIALTGEESALVNVMMDDGTEAVVWVGGACEVYFAHGRVNAFVKKVKDEA